MIDNGSSTNIRRTRTFFYVVLGDIATLSPCRPGDMEIERDLKLLLQTAFEMQEAYSQRLGQIVEKLSEGLTKRDVVYCSPHSGEFDRFKHEYQHHVMRSVTVVVK